MVVKGAALQTPGLPALGVPHIIDWSPLKHAHLFIIIIIIIFTIN